MAENRRWIAALAAALLAALASWYGGERLRGRYADALEPNLPPIPTREMVMAVDVANTEHAAVTYGLFGAVLAASLGLAGGLAGNFDRTGFALFLGLFAGGAAGYGTSVAVLPRYYAAFQPQNDDLLLALLTHGAIWSAIGAAAGLALGFGLGGWTRPVRAAIGGMLGAVAATMIYDIGFGLAFPLAKTSQPISATQGTRLLAQLAVAILVAIAAMTGARMPARPPKTAPSPDPSPVPSASPTEPIH